MRLLIILVGIFLSTNSFAEIATMSGVRIWPAPDNTRIVVELSKPVQYKIFRLENPPRLVLDLKNTHLIKTISKPDVRDHFIKKLRSGKRKKHDLRVVVDLKEPALYKSFVLQPNKKYGHRLVVDLRQTKIKPVKSKVVKSVKTFKPDKVRSRDVIIAIDAGHGGEDPGAMGYKGTYEKDVVLEIARRLKKLIDEKPGMRSVMIRDGDYYLSLRNRTLKARRSKADLFLSIHADAFRDSRVKGTSVYVLSENGATNEAARWLAEKENSSDLIGGVSLDDKDDLLASVLLDLSQTATIESSFQAGGEVLRRLGHIGKLHKKRVQQAGFVVLKSPDIPSLLIEAAFISNPRDEARLRSRAHQIKLAKAVVTGIEDYFQNNAPVGTYFSARKHVIASGDTLSEIAMKYHVSVGSIRNANALKSNKVRIGQILRIPFSSDG